MPLHVIDLVRTLSQGRCACFCPMGSAGWTTDPLTGTQEFHCERGPKEECLRCAARRCLEADGIEYEKIDHVQVIVKA